MMHTSNKYFFIQSFLKGKGIDEKKFYMSKLAGDGSTRIFERISIISLDKSYVIMENRPVNDLIKRENSAYLKIGQHLFKKGIPVPEICSCDLDEGLFILEDAGDRNMQAEVLESKDRIPVYEKVLEMLLRIQTEGKEGFNTDWCCQSKSYNAGLMKEKEAHYFRDSFLLNYMKFDFDTSSLEKAFDRIIMMADRSEKTFLMHRDFQSRNIMCPAKNKIAILDWQGARLGPLGYDLASLLFDPYTDLPGNERKSLFSNYCKMLEKINRTAADSLRESYPCIAVMRMLQAIGAFSNLSMNHGKKYFEEYIPPALNSLKNLLHEINYPEISYLERIVNDC